jgi:hypothetical protein
MDRKSFERAAKLRKDINALQKIIEEGRKMHWIKVICPVQIDWFPSEKFQNELLSWIESKVEEYEKEFESL